MQFFKHKDISDLEAAMISELITIAMLKRDHIPNLDIHINYLKE